MDLEFVKSWVDIKDVPELRAIYSDGATSGDQLPWEVRAALGDLLCQTTFDKNTAPQKAKFLEEINEALEASGSAAAKEQWAKLATLKTRDSSGTSRKHSKSSLYEVVKTAVEAERDLVELPVAATSEPNQGDDLEQINEFLDEPSQAPVKDEPMSDSEDDSGVAHCHFEVFEHDDMDLDATLPEGDVPACARDLFKALDSL